MVGCTPDLSIGFAEDALGFALQVGVNDALAVDVADLRPELVKCNPMP